MHEQSETIQLPSGEWVNVYGRKTSKAGQQLPNTPRFNSMEEAVGSAQQRSMGYGGMNLNKPKRIEPDPGLIGHMQEFPDTGSDVPKGFVPIESLATGDSSDPPTGFVPIESMSQPSWKDTATKVAKVLPELAYDFTLKPFVELGNVLREGRTTEQAQAWNTMTPDQQWAAREAGTAFVNPFDTKSIQPQVGAVFDAALAGSLFGKGGKGSLRTRSGPSERPSGQSTRPTIGKWTNKPTPPQGPRKGLLQLEGETLQGEIVRPQEQLALPVTKSTVTPRVKGPVATQQGIEQAKLIREQVKIDKLTKLIDAENKKLGINQGKEGDISERPVAPAEYGGYQEGFGTRPGFHLYTLTDTISPELVKGSTVTEKVLTEAGFDAPPIPEAKVKGSSSDVTLRSGLDPRDWAIFQALRLRSSKSSGPADPHILNTGLRILEKTVGPEVADQVAISHQRGKANLNRMAMQLSHTPLKFTPAEQLNFIDVMRGRSQPINKKVADAYGNVRLLTNSISDRIDQGGGEVYSAPKVTSTSGAVFSRGSYEPYIPVEHFYPELLNYHYVKKTSPNQLITELSAEPGQIGNGDPALMTQIVQGLIAQAEGKSIPVTVGPDAMNLLRKEQTITPHLTKRSGVVWPSTWLQPPHEVIPLYAKNMAHELSILETFGPRDIGIEGPLKVAADQGVPGAQLATKTWDLIRGREPHDPVSHSIDKMGSTLGNLATMMWIGPKTTVKQFSQLGLDFAEARSLSNFFKSLGTAVTKKGKYAADIEGATYGDIEADYISASNEQGHPAASWFDKAEQGTRNVATKVVNFAKVPKADAFGRRVGYHMAVKDIADLQASALKGDVNAIRWLKEDFHLDVNSPTEKVNFEAARFANKINLETGPLSVPIIAHMPRVKMFAHLQKFNMSWTSRLYNGFYKPLKTAIANGDKVGIARHSRRLIQLAVGSAFIGEPISSAIHAMVGRSDDRFGGSFTEFAGDIINGDATAKNILFRTLDNMAFAGMFGYMQIVKEGLFARGGPIESAARLGGMFVGAGVSNVAEIAANVGNVVKTGTTGTNKEFTRALGTAGRALTTRIPVAGPVVGNRIFTGGEGGEHTRAVNAINRAYARHPVDYKNVRYWQKWFYDRHGKQISPEAISKGR